MSVGYPDKAESVEGKCFEMKAQRMKELTLIID